MTNELLWFLNRSTGLVLLAVLTLSVLLGILAMRGRAGSLVPAFVSRSLHRNLSLFGLVLLAAHIGTAVLDEYVDIRWWHAFVPYGAAYEPLALGIGTVASDLMLAVLLTTVVRMRLGLGGWRRVHQLAYVAWAFGVAHGLMIGTDSNERWALIGYGSAAAVVAVGLAVRMTATALAEGEPA